MIVKGKARSGPEQLAAYLMRTTGGERATILDHVTEDDLHRTFMVWHVAGEATQGEKTLYHAQIAPDPRYKLTPEQGLRGAEILAEELGMANHPRRVVLHDGGDKPHLHVVFQRTNLDTMTLWDDSYNYVKHERASKRMALEFGHELVPGKHAKRDRKKQPEFPRAESTKADHQQAQRTGMSFDERKAELAGIRKSCDDAHAFKNALEEAGYVLAKGDTRGFVVVDRDGEVYSLSKHLAGDIKGKEYKAFMAPIDQAALPTVEEAKALHKQREEQTAVKAEKPGPEASKFLQPEAPAKVEEPAPAPSAALRTADPSKFLPEQPSGYDLAYYSPAKVAERASKFLPPAASETPAPVVAPPQAPEPAPQPASKFLPEKETVQPTPTAEKPAGIDLTLYAPAPTPLMPPAPVPPKAPAPEAPGDDWTRYTLKEEFKGLTPPAPPPAPPPPREDREIRELRKAVFKRQQEEYQKFTEANSGAYRALGTQLDHAMRWKMEDFDQIQAQARQDLVLRQTPKPRTGLRGMLDAIAEKLNPEATEQKAAEQKEDRDTLRLQQISDRIEYMKRLDLDKADQLQALRARQLQEQAAREKIYNEELDRHIQELLKVREIARDLAAEERKKKDDDLAREESGWAEDFKKEQEYQGEGPEPPEEGKG